MTVIRVNDFLAKLLPKDKDQLCIRLTDVSVAQVVFNNFLQPNKPAVWQQKLTYGQRELLLETAPSPTYLVAHRGWQGPLVLGAGILGTGLLGAFLMRGTGYTARVEAQVEEKIAELSESTDKLTGLYLLSPLGIALTDMDGRFIDLVCPCFCSHSCPMVQQHLRKICKLGVTCTNRLYPKRQPTNLPVEQPA